MFVKICSVAGCERKVEARGFCQKHYFRWRAHGDPTKTLIAPPGSGHIATGYRVHSVDGARKGDHVMVAERALGKPLPNGAEVHHVDENRLNNEPRNLVICQDGAYHMLLHVRSDALAACGNPDWRRCAYCKTYDDPAHLYKNPGSSTYNHRECFNARQRDLRAMRGRSDRRKVA